MSMWVLLLAAVCAAGILLVGAVLVTVFLIRGLRGGRGRETEAEEARRIQQFHRRLGRMEERIESLEAILIEGDTEKEGALR